MQTLDGGEGLGTRLCLHITHVRTNVMNHWIQIPSPPPFYAMSFRSHHTVLAVSPPPTYTSLLQQLLAQRVVFISKT